MASLDGPLRSELTIAETRIAKQAEIDLGVGYPEFTLPGWLANLWFDISLRELTWKYLRDNPDMLLPPGQSLPRTSELLNALTMSCLQYLKISMSHLDNSQLLYTGSHALDRVIAAVVEPGTRVSA